MDEVLEVMRQVLQQVQQVQQVLLLPQQQCQDDGRLLSLSHDKLESLEV